MGLILLLAFYNCFSKFLITQLIHLLVFLNALMILISVFKVSVEINFFK